MPSKTRTATFVAPSNIAFIKYWGTRNIERVLPFNPSISMTLRRCTSTCTVEFDPAGARDEIWFRQGGEELVPAAEGFARPVRSHLQRLRDRTGQQGACRVWTENSFPTGAGIASSASGFAALTLAATTAMGAPPGDPAEASVLARSSGSGSAARSVLGGYVEWPQPDQPDQPDPPARSDPPPAPTDPGEDSKSGPGDWAHGGEGPAVQIATAEHWDLRDVVAVVDAGQKSTSSRDGHARAPTSPRFEPRLAEIDSRLETVRRAIEKRDLDSLGPVIETEAIDLHHVAMSSRPPIYYWQGGTIAVLWAIRELRRGGIPVFATIDAGPNVHAICAAENEPKVAEALESLPEVQSTIRDGVGVGPSRTKTHLGTAV